MSSSALLALAAALVSPASGFPGSPLMGETPAQVQAKLGEPAVARAEAAGAFWTYRLPRCALFIYFADVGAGLRVSGAESGPRRYGEIPPDAETCMADSTVVTPHTPPAPDAAPAQTPPVSPS